MLKNLFKKLKLSEREKTTFPLVVVLLLAAAVIRMQPHLSNSSPFFAISILAGFILGANRSILASVLAVIAMFVGDIFLGFHWTMIFVYSGIALAALIGAGASLRIQSHTSWFAQSIFAFLTSAIASSTFFIISNFGVWLVGGLYPKTLFGLMTCFEMAIPFFTRSLGADVVFGTFFIMAALRLKSAIRVTPLAKNHGG